MFPFRILQRLTAPLVNPAVSLLAVVVPSLRRPAPELPADLEPLEVPEVCENLREWVQASAPDGLVRVFEVEAR
jgi:hypothetical protein